MADRETQGAKSLPRGHSRSSMKGVPARALSGLPHAPWSVPVFLKCRGESGITGRALYLRPFFSFCVPFVLGWTLEKALLHLSPVPTWHRMLHFPGFLLSFALTSQLSVRTVVFHLDLPCWSPRVLLGASVLSVGAPSLSSLTVAPLPMERSLPFRVPVASTPHQSHLPPHPLFTIILFPIPDSSLIICHFLKESTFMKTRLQAT